MHHEQIVWTSGGLFDQFAGLLLVAGNSTAPRVFIDCKVADATEVIKYKGMPIDGFEDVLDFFFSYFKNILSS